MDRQLGGFTVARDDRYFEDYPLGAVFTFGPVTVEANEMVAFAERFDPQAMHVDVAAASVGPYGGLIASGWFTVALMMRLLVDNYVSTVAGLVSPGFDDVRWLKPVRPGDELRLRVTILDARRSRSKPDRGIVVSLLECLDQEGTIVMRGKATGMMRVRLLLPQPDSPRTATISPGASTSETSARASARPKRRPTARSPGR